MSKRIPGHYPRHRPSDGTRRKPTPNNAASILAKALDYIRRASILAHAEGRVAEAEALERMFRDGFALHLRLGPPPER